MIILYCKNIKINIDWIQQKYILYKDINMSEDELNTYKEIVYNLPNPVTIICEGKFVYGNNAALNFLCLTKENALYDINPLSLIPEKALPEVQKTAIDILQGGSISNVETVLDLPYCKNIHVKISANFIRFEGKPAIFITIDDITESRKFAANSDLMERRFRTLLNNSPGFYYKCHNDNFWTMIDMSDKCFEITGYKPSEFINNAKLSYESIIFPEDREQIRDKINNAISDKIPFQIEYRIRTKSGHIKYVWEKGIAVYEPGDKDITLEGFIMDVTNLMTALKKSKESDNLKNNLLANLNHEFRTPMNSIMGYAEIISSLSADEKILEFTKGILSSSKRLMATLESILKFSEIVSNTLVVNYEILNIVEVVRNQIRIFEISARKKNIILKNICNTEEIFCNLDRVLIGTIVHNLIDNAIKFTNAGTVTVETSVVKLPDAFELAVIKVKDTGIGISRKYHSIIFEEFKQISEGIGRSFEGSGLGLTIAKKLTEIMNGKLNFDSSPGLGSVFTVSFPIVNYKKSGSEQINTPEIIKNKPEVLIVEDNKSNVLVVKNFLRKIANCDYSLNSRDALAMCQSKKYDIILLDINLGERITGEDVMLEIKKIPANENTPIIAVTGYAMSGDKERLLAKGFSEYISKPFDQESLIKLINKTVEEFC